MGAFHRSKKYERPIKKEEQKNGAENTADKTNDSRILRVIYIERRG